MKTALYNFYYTFRMWDKKKKKKNGAASTAAAKKDYKILATH